MKALTLPILALALWMTPVAYAEPGPQRGAPNPMVVAQETLSLERYLRGPGGRHFGGHGDDYIQLEIARIKLQREVFRAYRHQWWMEYSERIRDQNIQRYWDAYYQGQAFAQSITSGRSQFGVCQLVQTALGNPGGDALDRAIPEIPDHPSFHDAFRRGVVSAYPDCLVTGGQAGLHEIETMLADLTTSLTRIRQDLIAKIPTPQALQDLADQYRAQALALIDSAVVRNQATLGTSFAVAPESARRIQLRAQNIKAMIDCDHLVDRTGRSMSCQIPLIESELGSDRRAAYRLFYGVDQAGLYQPLVALSGMLEATSIYLALNPSDTLVRNELRLLRADLAQVDSVQGDRLALKIKDAKDDLRLSLQAFANSKIYFWRDRLPVADRAAIQTAFFALRTRLIAYGRWELTSDREASLFDRLSAEYSALLQTAMNLSAGWSLPIEPLEVRFSSDLIPEETFRIPYDLPQIPVAYFMGDTAAELALWQEKLSLPDLSN